MRIVSFRPSGEQLEAKLMLDGTTDQPDPGTIPDVQIVPTEPGTPIPGTPIPSPSIDYGPGPAYTPPETDAEFYRLFMQQQNLRNVNNDPNIVSPAIASLSEEMAAAYAQYVSRLMGNPDPTPNGTGPAAPNYVPLGPDQGNPVDPDTDLPPLVDGDPPYQYFPISYS